QSASSKRPPAFRQTRFPLHRRGEKPWALTYLDANALSGLPSWEGGTSRMPEQVSKEMRQGLFRAAIILTVSYMGTTVFAVIAGLFAFIASMLIKGYREGWAAVRWSWIGDVG